MTDDPTKLAEQLSEAIEITTKEVKLNPYESSIAAIKDTGGNTLSPLIQLHKTGDQTDQRTIEAQQNFLQGLLACTNMEEFERTKKERYDVFMGIIGKAQEGDWLSIEFLIELDHTCEEYCFYNEDRELMEY